MYYLIYQITNNIDGKIYIGMHQTYTLEDGYMGSGKLIKRAIEKHGIENFTKDILYSFDNAEEMLLKEAEIVDEEFVEKESTYNLVVGGKGGFSFINMNRLNVYEGIGLEKTGSQNLLRGRKLHDKLEMENSYDEYRSKISKTLKDRFLNQDHQWLGKNHKDSSKQLISQKLKISQSGNKNSQFGTMWINNGIEAKKIKKDETIPDGWMKGRKLK